MSVQDRDCIIGLGSAGPVNLVMVCITAALFHEPGLTGISNLGPLVNRPDPAGHWHAQLAFVDTGIAAHLLGQDTARLAETAADGPEMGRQRINDDTFVALSARRGVRHCLAVFILEGRGRVKEGVDPDHDDAVVTLTEHLDAMLVCRVSRCVS